MLASKFATLICSCPCYIPHKFISFYDIFSSLSPARSAYIQQLLSENGLPYWIWLKGGSSKPSALSLSGSALVFLRRSRRSFSVMTFQMWLNNTYRAVCERPGALTLSEAELLGMNVVKISSLRRTFGVIGKGMLQWTCHRL